MVSPFRHHPCYWPAGVFGNKFLIRLIEVELDWPLHESLNLYVHGGGGGGGMEPSYWVIVTRLATLCTKELESLGGGGGGGGGWSQEVV